MGTCCHLQNSTHPTTSTVPFPRKMSSEGVRFLSKTKNYQKTTNVFHNALTALNFTCQIYYLVLVEEFQVGYKKNFFLRYNRTISSMTLSGRCTSELPGELSENMPSLTHRWWLSISGCGAEWHSSWEALRGLGPPGLEERVLGGTSECVLDGQI